MRFIFNRVHAQVSALGSWDVRPLGAGVTGSCEPLDVGGGTKLCESSIPFSLPPLQPLFLLPFETTPSSSGYSEILDPSPHLQNTGLASVHTTLCFIFISL